LENWGRVMKVPSCSLPDQDNSKVVKSDKKGLTIVVKYLVHVGSNNIRMLQK
jgi:hypothetical protein